MLATRQPLAAHYTHTLPANGMLSRAQPVASLVLRQQVRGRTLLRAAFPGTQMATFFAPALGLPQPTQAHGCPQLQ
jgi:hypothetical protein